MNFGLQNGRDDDLGEYLGKREAAMMEVGADSNIN